MKQKTARWLRLAADWLDPPALALTTAPVPELVAALQDAGPGPQLRLARQMINQMRAAEILQRALNRYAPARDYRA